MLTGKYTTAASTGCRRNGQVWVNSLARATFESLSPKTFAAACDDFADEPTFKTKPGELLLDAFGVVLADDHRQTDAHVKDTEHLVVVDFAQLL